MLLQLDGARTVFGLIVFAVVISVPGYFWTLAFFPQKRSLGRTERVAFSVLFSVTILPLAVLVESTLFGFPVDFFSVLSNLLALTVVSLLIYLVRTQRVKAPQAFYRVFPKTGKEDSVEIIPKIF